MARQRFGSLLALLFLLFATQSFSSTAPPACDAPGSWFSSVLPPEVIALVCGIIDTANPVDLHFEVGGPSASPQSTLAAEVETVIQEANPPEQTKQELILRLLFWTQP